jgi:hypothetical protein
MPDLILEAQADLGLPCGKVVANIKDSLQFLKPFCQPPDTLFQVMGIA